MKYGDPSRKSYPQPLEGTFFIPGSFVKMNNIFLLKLFQKFFHNRETGDTGLTNTSIYVLSIIPCSASMKETPLFSLVTCGIEHSEPR